MTRTIKSFLLLAAVSGLALGGATSAGAEKTIGGFPIGGSGGSKPTGDGDRAGRSGQLDQVVVSQNADSKVRTIAAAMRLVRPGGTILVQGGFYDENIVVTKPVALIGMEDAYGREAIFRPASSSACVSIAPDSPLAAVSISKLVFEFDQNRSGAPCIDVQGGTVSVRDNFIIPADSGIPRRAAFGSIRPGLVDHIARPPRDRGPEADRRVRVEQYFARHAQPVGADHLDWDVITGGTRVEGYIHARNQVGAGRLNGPAAGVRISAGDVRLDSNVIIGAQNGIEFASHHGARIRGEVSNNVLLGNGIGVLAVGSNGGDDLLVTRNTIRFNSDSGIKADVYDGMKILANEIMGNASGIVMSENVRLATINSNFIVQNTGDAMKVSTGFFGAVSGNTFADNAGCTVQFFSAEQKILNNADVKVTAFQDFEPRLLYEQSNASLDNQEDRPVKGAKRPKRGQPVQSVSYLPACNGAL